MRIKVLCKNCIVSKGFQEGEWYYADEWLRIGFKDSVPTYWVHNNKECNGIGGSFLLKPRESGHPLDGLFDNLFKDYFYTEQEIRKIKLKKIVDTKNTY